MADLAFFAISTQPWRESDLQSNLRDYYSKSGSPLHSGGTVEQTQYCYYGLLPAVGPMYGMIVCFNTDGDVIGYVTVDIDYPKDA